MITAIHSNKAVVVSDLHLGNPFSNKKSEFVKFLRWAAKNDYDIIMNGDGLEIAQASFDKIAQDLPEVLQVLREVSAMGKNIYYVVGNHDIALEHFLEDWGAVKVSPFLNLSCDVQSHPDSDFKKRIRIEHGHLYDPFFVKHPIAYEFLTRVAGLFLKLSPKLYRGWIMWEKYLAYRRWKKTGIMGEPAEFAVAALELSRRGFDSVIFGHTHHRGDVTLANNKKYFNSGSWMISCHYLEIINGQITSKNWTK